MHDLDGDRALQPKISRLVNGSHPALTKKAIHSIILDCFAE